MKNEENVIRKIKNGIKGLFYSIKIKIFPYRESKRKKMSLKTRNLIFFIIIAFLPLAKLVLDWGLININAIVLSFKAFDENGSLYFAGFDNFKKIFTDYIANPNMLLQLKNSIKIYLISVVVTAVIPILFAYYVFKKLPGSGFFKVMLFLPSIISGLVTVLLFKIIANRVYPNIVFKLTGKEIIGLLNRDETRFTTILVYTMWMSFGGGLLTFVGAMNSTDISTIEAGKLDGVGFLGELWHIVLPKSYKVITIGMIAGVSSIFTNQFGLYAFYGPDAPQDVMTLGYWFYVETLDAQASGNSFSYPYLSAWGLIASCISIPLTFLLRFVIYHFGPSEE